MTRKQLAQPTTVEYDARGKRIRKTLDNSWAARCFYSKKLRQGHDPKYVKGA